MQPKSRTWQTSLFVLAFVASLFTFFQCSKKAATKVAEPEELKVITHEEGADTLRNEDIAEHEMKPISLKWLSGKALHNVLDTASLQNLIVNYGYPDYGFYGADRYKIEMILTKVTKDPDNPLVYHVEGKNRYKKNITNFMGTVTIDSLARIIDPNLDTSEVGDLGVQKIYTANGRFDLKEDSLRAGSGRFTGRLKMDFATYDKAPVELWYFSETPNQGSGIRYDGTWTSYKTNKSKPIIWAKDLFRFANDILEDFAMGERDVEINAKYRNLGWDNYWANEEWWNDSGKKKSL
jgi:hypothetical protein